MSCFTEKECKKVVNLIIFVVDGVEENEEDDDGVLFCGSSLRFQCKIAPLVDLLTIVVSLRA